MIATVTLNPSIDHHFYVRKLALDDANRAERVRRYPGGKGFNVSKAVHAMGEPTRAYVPLAGGPGAEWRRLADAIGVPYRALAVAGETRTNVILTDPRDGSQTRVSAPGPRMDGRACMAFLKWLRAARPRPACWVLSGGLPAGAPADTYERFVRQLQADGARCFLDADSDALKLGLRARPYLIKPNEHELRRLTGQRLSSVRDHLEAARELAASGRCAVAVVSLGERGAVLAADGETFHVSAPKVPVLNQVGAGDALVGGLAVGLMRGWGLRRSLVLGVAAGASAVQRDLPGLIERRDLAGLIRRVKVRV